MNAIKDTIYINVEYVDGQDEGDDGTSYFVASCDDLMFTTDGETFEELLTNIQECLTLTLVDGDSIAEYGVEPNAVVKIIMDVPKNYARSA